MLERFAREHETELEVVHSPEEVHSLLNRALPGCLILDLEDEAEAPLELCRALKADAFTSIVPVVFMAHGDGDDLSTSALVAGGDEVIRIGLPEREKWLRLQSVVRRAVRDVNVHPTTRLPGTIQIERDLAIRLERGESFALCYADLDHFKEFNDRYGYNNGDRVIRLLSRILRDLVRGLAPGGFVGHIGGDDFIFTVALEYMETCCDEILQLFDDLIPYQYSEEDRRAGYFLGKDRRGNVHRIPLMTLSIGVVTNRVQGFTHTAQVSERAGEMKTYAKGLPGSVYVVDRRQAFTDEFDEDA
ncbi:MAG: diguanylate cyclase [Gemmatimonadota bacterium]